MFDSGFYLRIGKLFIVADAERSEDLPFGYFDLSWNNKLLIELS